MAIEWGIDRNVIRNHWVLDVLGYPQFWGTYPSSFWNSGHAQHLTLRQQAVRKSPHRAVGEPRNPRSFRYTFEGFRRLGSQWEANVVAHGSAWLHFTGQQWSPAFHHGIHLLPGREAQVALGVWTPSWERAKRGDQPNQPLRSLRKRLSRVEKLWRCRQETETCMFLLQVSRCFTTFHDVSHVSCFRDNLFRNIVVFINSISFTPLTALELELPSSFGFRC